ncbi:hypothetical protein PMAN_a1278 [Pseudoalteromonas marina]|nr:hypothetical protein ATW7_13983 [Alteromonadales bacterium TW-7]KAF7780274.1 hypothetical protein PMAN_a1278 [Pseudoalteromonas marina]GAA76278.1 hypothetical protein P20480_2751 [Pseudoalteromonas sp. BSi20480]
MELFPHFFVYEVQPLFHICKDFIIQIKINLKQLLVYYFKLIK